MIFEGVRGTITSQIAVKMAFDAALERSLDPTLGKTTSPLASAVVREAFKEANARVYQYGHRMGAGGTMAASGVLAALADGRFTVGRVGSYEGFLFRAGAITPLFEPAEAQPRPTAGVLTRFIGANAQILVDLASLEVRDEDIIVFTTATLDSAALRICEELLGSSLPLASKGTRLLRDLQVKQDAARPQILALLQVGRPTIVLREVIE